MEFFLEKRAELGQLSEPKIELSQWLGFKNNQDLKCKQKYYLW